MRILAALLLLATAPLAAKPNVVILVADDWAMTDVGAFGGEIPTPNLDALAMRGVRFSNFHVAGSCSPTRAMLQTGTGNHRNGLGNMPETIPPEHVGKPGYDTVLADGIPTLGDMFRSGGYRTYLIGKWHLGKTASKLPHARGYDRAFSLADAGADNFEQKPIGGLQDKADWTENGRPAQLPKDFYSSRFLVDQTLAYVRRDAASGKPFLAVVNFLANHIPLQAPDADIAAAHRYGEGWTAIRQARRDRAAALGLLPAGVPMQTMASTRDWTSADRATEAKRMQVYAAMATAMDREIGRLVAALKADGSYDNTVFVFLSDNGAEPTDPMGNVIGKANTRWFYDVSPAQFGRPGSFTYLGPSWASAAASPFAGYKFSAAEGGLRVPLIVSWAGNPALVPGRVAKSFTHVTDIAPTLLQLTGVAPVAGPEPLTGKSLVPLLTGAADSVRLPDEAVGYELSGNAALFQGDYKLVKNLPPLGDGRWHLYDIVRDPGETRDLAAAEPTRFREMQARYDRWAADNGVLAMPEGYVVGKQIQENAMRAVWWPKVKPVLIGLALALLAFAGWRIARKRRAA
jgi:arylsulfatase/uncharacterized sulfatase